MTTSIDGLISGLDTTSLIDEILTYQQRAVDQIKTRIETETEKRTQLLAFTAKVLTLQSKANALSKAASFGTPLVTSSNEDVLEARGGEDLPTGSYRFRVRQLASSDQYASNGFASSTTPIGAGTLTIDASGATLDHKTELEVLNGGIGVRRGSIRITNRAGQSAVVDLSSALTLQDAIDAIDAAGIDVTASVAGTASAHPGEGLVLTDSSGGSGTLRVSEVSGGKTAADLGILGSSDGESLEGSGVLVLGSGLSLGVLNDGLGVRLAAGGDLQIQQRDGTSFTVDLGSAATLGEVISAIEEAAGNTGVTVALSGRRLVATDASTGTGTFSISDVGSGHAGTDLGLTAAASGGTIEGDAILAGIDSVLLANLRGGTGIPDGAIRITDRAGASSEIDVGSAETLGEVLAAINEAGIGVEASLNEQGDGIALRDMSGGVGLFRVEEVGAGTAAASLGILQAAGIDGDVIEGEDIHFRAIGENTLLDSLNGGQGVGEGSIRIVDPSGRTFTVNLAQEETVGDVLKDLNGAASMAGSDVTASLNDEGNGIILRAASGSGLLTVSEVGGGTTARDLNIAGSASEDSPWTIDGSFERTIEITDEDTLETIADRIGTLGLGVTASVLDDGSSLAPKRLQLVSDRPGSTGRIAVRTSGDTALRFDLTDRGRDAVIFYGGAGGRPVVLRSSTNEFREVVKGLTVTARAVSDDPISVTASRDLEGVEEAIGALVETYNEVIDEIGSLTRYDTTTEEKGILMGESALRAVERQISNAIIRPVSGLSSGSNLASQIGIRTTADGKLTFDSEKFYKMATEDPDAIEDILTRSRTLEDTTLLENFANGEGVSSTAGGAEMRIHRRDGTTFEVDLTGDRTVRDLLASINGATGNGGTVKASISADGRSIVLVDSTAGSTAFRVESLNSSSSYSRLGLDKGADSSGGGTITGRQIDLSEDPGVARRLYDGLVDLLDTTKGVLQMRADNYAAVIEDLTERKEAKEESLANREVQLREQFANLEILMSQNQNTLQQLTAALSSR